MDRVYCILRKNNKKNLSIKNRFLLMVLFGFCSFLNAQTGKSEENSRENTTNGIPSSVNNSNAPSVNSISIGVSADTAVFELEEDRKLKSSEKLKSKKTVSKDFNENSNESQITQKKMQFSKVKVASSTQRMQRSPSAEQQKAMDQQVEEIKNIAPNSFDYNLMYYSSGNYDVSREKELKQAENIDPENIDVLKLSAANAIVKGDTTEALNYLKKLELNQSIQPETISYTQDIIVSSLANSTIVTHGYNDSYGAYFNQFNLNMAPNTTLVSLDFLQSESYRKVLRKKGYDIPSQKIVDVSYLKSFCELNQGKNIALSMTIPKEYFEPIKNNIFVSGLIFEYRPNSSESSIEKLEKLWNTDLNKQVINQFISPLSNSYGLNYLPMLRVLENYYQKSGNNDFFQKTTLDIDRIQKKAGISNQMKKKKE